MVDVQSYRPTLGDFTLLLGLLCMNAYFGANGWLFAFFNGYDSRPWLSRLVYTSVFAIFLFFLVLPHELPLWLWGFWLTCAALLSGCLLETVILSRKNKVS
ncbi:MAG: hypothetical protein H0T73_19935 [Ardenticatenales bacterium]|nr:hypothetical protein [Ardenticatenales bacterium]